MAIAFSGGPTGTEAALDLPPAGRSLFDHMTSREVEGRRVQRVPYPFPALLAELERHAGSDALGRSGIAAVLIPLGRSLQRNASPGDAFRHPRVVVAVTGEALPGAGQRLLLKDRLFLGFQDDAGVIEVISYNERAGRFEFQLVTDYRPGGSPQVSYARRALCVSCHHAGGPIFSRPSWDETNANPAVARALAAHAQRFHGVAVGRGVDVPNSIDDAVARANRLAMAQMIWRDGCARVEAPSDPIACRQDTLLAAVTVRLSDTRAAAVASEHAPAHEALRPLLSAWKTQWPQGVPEPDANIANRDPFLGQAQQLPRSPAATTPWGADEITPAVDPIMARPPVGVWHADAHGADRFVRTVASLLARSDIEQIARRLEQGGKQQGEGYAALERAVARIAADARGGRTDVLSALPFRRAASMRALFRHLGIATPPSCCDTSTAEFPPALPATDQQAAPEPVPPALRAFYQHCATCHDLPTASPPGFLHGRIDAVERSLQRCAPRIRFRLQMWRLGADARPKVPMPPPVFVPAWEHAPPQGDIETMLRYLDPALGPVAGVQDRAYETLPACREQGPAAFEGTPGSSHRSQFSERPTRESRP